MRTIIHPLIALLLACPALLVGCNSSSTADASADPETAFAPVTEYFTFHRDQYSQVHQAAVEVLHDHGYRVARNDYRFGVITTHPKEAPTTIEFWIDDPTTPEQHRADTLNAQQRKVMIEIQRIDTPGSELNVSQDGGQRPGDAVPRLKSQTYYILTVQVMVDRLQRPARYLTHSATTRLSADYAGTPTQLRDRGIEGDYAQAMTRDPELESRLVNAIARKARELAKADALQPGEAPDATPE